MFGRQNFRDCVSANLKAKGYGAKGIDKVLDDFNRRTEINLRNGMGEVEASFHALQATIDSQTWKLREKQKQANKKFAVAAQTADRIRQGYDVTTSSLVGDRGAGLKGSAGVGFARAVASMLQGDARFKGRNFETVYNGYIGRYGELFADALDVIGKGVFGVQRGAAHFPNIVRELWGTNTGDAEAALIAKAYLKLQDTMLDDFNRVGGSIRKRADFRLPQWHNVAKTVKAGADKWIEDHMRWLDWDKMMLDDGRLIPPDEREAVLREVYATQASDGATKIDPTKFGGKGHSIGNQLEKHRFLVYKSSDAWLEQHELYGDGTVFDVMMEHMNDMARQTSLVDMFGPNPDVWFDEAKAMVRREAGIAQQTAASLGKKGRKENRMVSDADEAMRRVEAMWIVTRRKNSLNPNNMLANSVTATSNLLVGAQLSGAVVLAAPGDLLTTGAVRMFNNMPVTAGISTYLKGMAPGEQTTRMLTRAGFVIDEVIGSTYAAERFGAIATNLAPTTRRIGDTALRASGLNRHTNAARGATRLEMMGHLDELRNTEWDALPIKHVMERYGINKRDWDVVRKLPAWEPQPGAKFFRPVDIMSSKLIDRDQLYQKFFGMIDQESRYMVPASTIEASAVLKGTTRPDNVPGALLHSFSMYKNYPVSMVMTYGRLALSSPNTMTRIGFLAGLGVGMTAVGALATQMRELLKGREPMPMDNGLFWGKAALTGGALGIWGDALFNGVNEYGRDFRTQVSGPLAGFAADTLNLTVGQPFKWAEASDWFDGTFKAGLVEYGKRYIPGSNLWYARLVLEREVWDRIAEAVDPKARQKQRRKVQRQKKTYGNAYYYAPGESLFD
jgi:hypothetical protein